MRVEELDTVQARIQALIGVIENDSTLRRSAGAALRHLRGIHWATLAVRARLPHSLPPTSPILGWRSPTRTAS